MRNTPESRACGILHGNCTRKCRCWQARRCDDWKNARALDVDVETMRCPDIQMRNFSTIDLHFIISTMKIRDRKPAFLCRNTRLSKEHERGMRRHNGRSLAEPEQGNGCDWECYRKQGDRPDQNTDVAAAARGHFWRGTVGQPTSLVVLWATRTQWAVLTNVRYAYATM